MSFLLCTFARAPFERYVTKDNMNGTITVRIEKVSGCGMVSLVSDGTLLKKCLQGQVYRSAQNDCKGTGTAADYYGAQKFQWCPTNDGACDNSPNTASVPSPKISPAGKSCYDETPIGTRHWSLLGAYFNDDASPLYSYSERKDEIPITEYVWIIYSPFANISQAATITFSEPQKTVLFAKNSYFYVLCVN
ncbi:MAG TPA: hypothetical protein PK453_28390 [Leptospiraceae bacterium]|nr:hypothetical protein [Leptospiraceae bacterium]